jgi:alanyl-tRNA synthetase
VADVLKQEEERFFATIENGMAILEGAGAHGTGRQTRSTARPPSSCTTPTASRST